VQVFVHRILSHVLRNPGPLRPPLLFRLLTSIPGFPNLAGRFVGIGLQPQHIKKI
jgi:hypothetical protein